MTNTTLVRCFEPNGNEVYINPVYVTSIREDSCLEEYSFIRMTDGHISVRGRPDEIAAKFFPVPYENGEYV